MGDRWRVEVDRSVCIGSGFCVGTAPDGPRLDEGRRQAVPVGVEIDAYEDVPTAEGCPVEAITITLVDGREAVFPPEE